MKNEAAGRVEIEKEIPDNMIIKDLQKVFANMRLGTPYYSIQSHQKHRQTPPHYIKNPPARFRRLPLSTPIPQILLKAVQQMLLPTLQPSIPPTHGSQKHIRLGDHVLGREVRPTEEQPLQSDVFALHDLFAEHPLVDDVSVVHLFASLVIGCDSLENWGKGSGDIVVRVSS